MHPRHVERLIESSRISAEEREMLAPKPQNGETAPEAPLYDPVLDAEIETLMTQPHPPFSFDNIWPPLSSPATPIYHLLLRSRLLGGCGSTAVEDISKLLDIFNATQSHFIRHQATRGLATYAIIHKAVLPADMYQHLYTVLSAIDDETLFDPKMPNGSLDWLGLGTKYSTKEDSKGATVGE